MGLKDFMLKQALKHKLKDVPEGQRDMLMSLMEENPEFFKKFGDEVKQLTREGYGETSATMVVMRKHQAEFQKFMSNPKH